MRKNQLQNLNGIANAPYVQMSEPNDQHIAKRTNVLGSNYLKCQKKKKKDERKIIAKNKAKVILARTMKF